MRLTLSISTNPLVNRFAEPDDLTETVARDIRVRDLQLTHEFLDPSWPAAVLRRRVRAFGRAMERTGIRVTSGMTGPYGRLNHFGHPDRDVRRYHLDWFKTFADLIADLGGRAIGTQFAILTFRDQDDPARREAMIRIALDCWAELADHAREAGLSFLFWEPMSIAREFGETIPAALALQARIDAAGLSLPLRMMADIDHGDVTSPDPDDTDPYAWARAVPRHSPIIHIKQSMMDKGGHRPFTARHNATGRIRPGPLLAALAEGGATDNEICLELSWKEREPDDRRVVAELAESVAYWAPYIDTGAAALRASPAACPSQAADHLT